MYHVYTPHINLVDHSTWKEIDIVLRTLVIRTTFQHVEVKYHIHLADYVPKNTTCPSALCTLLKVINGLLIFLILQRTRDAEYVE